MKLHFYSGVFVERKYDCIIEHNKEPNSVLFHASKNYFKQISKQDGEFHVFSNILLSFYALQFCIRKGSIDGGDVLLHYFDGDEAEVIIAIDFDGWPIDPPAGCLDDDAYRQN